MAQFTNRAQLTYGGATIDSNTVTGQLREVLSATKLATNATYRAGDTVTYAVSLINSGAVPLTDLTLTDDLGAITAPSGATYQPLSYVDGTVRYLINGVQRPAPTVTVGDTLTVTGITVPAGGNALLLYDALVNDYADPTPTGTLTNTVTVTGGGISALTASATVSAASDARLSITKSISPVPVVENGILTYGFLIENFGSAAVDEAGDLTVTDTFQPTLGGITVTLNGETLTADTDYTYDATSGAFATVPGKITVPAATYSQGPDGTWITTPGAATLTVSGTV